MAETTVNTVFKRGYEFKCGNSIKSLSYLDKDQRRNHYLKYKGEFERNQRSKLLAFNYHGIDVVGDYIFAFIKKNTILLFCVLK